MNIQRNRQIMRCQDCGGIAPAQVEADGTIHIPDDPSMGGCESHQFVALNGELEGTTDDSTLLDTIFDLLTEKRRRYAL